MFFKNSVLYTFVNISKYTLIKVQMFPYAIQYSIFTLLKQNNKQNTLDIFFESLFFIYFYYNYIDFSKMGNSTCKSFPNIFNKEFDVPDLKQRSTYGVTQSKPDEHIIRAIFSQNYNQNRNSMVADMISQNKQKLFQDKNFVLDSKDSSRLSVFFDFKRNKTRIYTTKSETDITSFIQLNVEFAYLTAVCYFFCRKEVKSHLIRRVIQTQQTNDYGAYSLNFYSNGEPHSVMIDDKMPTNSDSFVYLRIVTGFQLWPLIIEKAWCKQIGSYERAKGLSPEDAFEEITGIPSYTYAIHSTNRASIKQLLKTGINEGYWVALVARNNLPDLRNRQVFYLQNWDDKDSLLIISPYISYNFKDGKQERRGQFSIKQQDIFTHFQHAVIGFYKKDYQLTSIQVQSKSHQELLFSINVNKKEDISIRFNQFYAGYLQEEERHNYQYSPVMLQLYKVNQSDGDKRDYSLVNHCEGCNHSRSGARSSQCSDNIFESLQGLYILRLEVEWNHELILNRGNIVVYASEGNVEIAPIKNNNQFAKEIYPNVIQKQKSSKRLQITALKQHDMELHTYQKMHSVLLMFKNMSNSQQSYQIDFSKSNNVLIRGSEVKDKVCVIRMEGLQSALIELVPIQLKNTMEIKDFDITKIANKP